MFEEIKTLKATVALMEKKVERLEKELEKKKELPQEEITLLVQKEIEKLLKEKNLKAMDVSQENEKKKEDSH